MVYWLIKQINAGGMVGIMGVVVYRIRADVKAIWIGAVCND